MTDENDFPIDLSIETILDEMEIRYHRDTKEYSAKFMNTRIFYDYETSPETVAGILRGEIMEELNIKETE